MQRKHLQPFLQLQLRRSQGKHTLITLYPRRRIFDSLKVLGLSTN